MSSDAGGAFDTAAAIVRRLRAAGHEAHLVGGCVRDRLRGVEPGDYDVATSASPGEVGALFGHTIPVGESFGVVFVVEGGRPFEVATFRAEGPYEDGRRPKSVRPARAREDALRRDFTVNALFMDPDSLEVTDFVGGVADLARRIVRTVGEPRERFAEDHLRMLRAVRFAANLGFEIEAATLAAVREAAQLVARVSAERVREELTKMLMRGGAARGMELLRETGLLGVVLPELLPMIGCEQPREFHPEGDVWTHVLRMLSLLPEKPDARLAWAVLLHDAGKPATRALDPDGRARFPGHTEEGVRIARGMTSRLRFSSADAGSIEALVANHMRFIHVAEMRESRLKRFLRLPDFDLHLELHRLDCLASHGKLDAYDFARARLASLPPEELRPPRLLTGDDLIAMGFRPGPVFSEILSAVEDAQLEGGIATPDEARRLVLGSWKPPPRE